MPKTSYVIPNNQLSLFEFDTPSMPAFDKSRCEARLINYETAARMVETYHYAHRVPSIKIAFGLYLDAILSGCITYSTVFANIGSAICGLDYALCVLELSRLYTFDHLPKNTESWLIAQSFKLLSSKMPSICILLSYSDLGQSHIGYVYQATNWLYTGKSNGTTEYILNGKIVSARNEGFRNGTSNSRGTVIPLENLQKMYPGIEKVRTSPKHRYVYFLGSKSQRKTLRKALKWPVLPYPKANDTP